MAKARRVPSASYLYVMALEHRTGADDIKVGRSVDPQQRRAQLQTGQGEKLELLGKWRVRYADAPRLEALAKSTLRPLRRKGEVFRLREHLACGVVEWIASGRPVDRLIDLAIEHEVATHAWERLLFLPGTSGRWAKPNLVAELNAAEAEMKRLRDEMTEIDPVRAQAIDPLVLMVDAPSAGTSARNTRRSPAHAA